MSNNDSGNNSPTDIITYIGVPLAVLGVLPILYNTLSTLAALSKIKRMLRRGKLTALTRSDIINKVIEVELPRYAVQPWDRYNHRSEYWQLSRQPSSIPGGSWTTFNWKTNTIGIKTQRLEYADQLRQPQVEVEFQELVAYLLDLGGVPNAQGWRMLRSSGLWTPTGCSLMSSPDGTRPALKMSSLDDSDGHLSLKVTWEPSWTTRDASTLPPYWIRLPPPPPAPKETASSAEASTSQEVAGTETATEEEKTGNDESSEGDTEKEKGKDKKEKELTPKQSMDSVQKQAEKNASEPIICQFTVDGLQSALSQDFAQSPSRVPSTFSSPSSAAALEVQSLYIDHLRVTRNGRTNGTWFASAATAYGTTSQTVLWNYLIPEEILNFSRRDSVPCGVLEILGVVSSEKTPQWQMNSTDNDSMEAHELFIRRMREQRDAMAAEAKMDPAQRQFAASQRMHREMAQRMDDSEFLPFSRIFDSFFLHFTWLYLIFLADSLFDERWERYKTSCRARPLMAGK